ncbi:hypothetical protein [Actinoplanes sp. NPDC049118]|uniref:hypothetical protein n=1 Tax=Actinoplanes sp. NPDC049118 TaxID=3155769 RepID=UPI0033CD400D
MGSKYELRRTFSDGKSRQVATCDDPNKLREREQEMRTRRVTGSSTSYSVRKKG